MLTEKFDTSKKYKTADGRYVVTVHRFNHTDNEKTVFAEVVHWDEFVVLLGYYEDGTYFGNNIPSVNDLIIYDEKNDELLFERRYQSDGRTENSRTT